jgi:23S rRNA (cytidine1920-2'-O)/16S rRNA (cytidine1409-2'-O)-methyltransferase
MKVRLDQLLLVRYPTYSRHQIQSWIMQGKVKHRENCLVKPGMMVDRQVELVCDFSQPRYVSRAGYKLEKALDYFAIDVADYCAMDAGISTGGFTDCLLQRGVRKVYGIDVGYGQVDENIRRSERVVLLERTNLRYVRDLGELVDLVTLDLSFISVSKVLEAVCAVLKPGGELVVLIKPQFEAKREQVGRKGVIKDPAVHQDVVDKVVKFAQEQGFCLKGVIESPIEGATGNKEFLAYFRYKIN